MSTLLDEVRLHQGHPLCTKSWLQCLQEFLQIKALILQLLCKTNSPKLQVPLEFGAPWIFGSLNYPCTPSISSLESSMLCAVNKPPSTSRTVRKTPKSWENQLTIPSSTLENLHTQRQSDSKKKCLILKNVWTMSFWDLERLDVNDSILWVLWGSEYNRKGWQEQDFNQKQHFESIQLMSESIQTIKRIE